MTTDLLVVGAGTTGLTLALQAVVHGARVRVVDRLAAPARTSRVVVLNPRSLELLRPLGVTDALLARGDPAPELQLHLRSRVVTVSLDRFLLPGTAFPHLLMIRQWELEGVLAAALAAHGVQVEWATEVVRVARVGTVGGGGARAVLRRPGAPPDAVWCRYLAGCDGPDSLVRRSVGGWLGGDDRQEVVVADLELGPAAAADDDARARAVPPVLLEPGPAHVALARRGLAALVWVGEPAGWRMLATRSAAYPQPFDEARPRGPAGQPGPSIPPVELQRLIDAAGLPGRIREVAWSAPVRVQHRLASRFSRGPLFVAGDAAHAVSPACAQGMNAGIHDAVNLGWKLAFAAAAGRRAAAAADVPDADAAPGVVPGAASSEHPGTSQALSSGASAALSGLSPGSRAALPGSALLDSYAQERRRADRVAVRLTHAVFWAGASLHPLAQLGRLVLVPAIGPGLPWLMRRRRLAASGVRTLAQFRLRYAHSPLTVQLPASPERVRGGLARRALRPGSRVADTLVRCAGRRVRLHELLAEPGVHILLQADAAGIPERMLGPLVHAVRLDDRPGTGMLVVRPDGHVALRAPEVDTTHLAAWLRLVGLPVV